MPTPFVYLLGEKITQQHPVGHLKKASRWLQESFAITEVLPMNLPVIVSVQLPSLFKLREITKDYDSSPKDPALPAT